MGYYGTLLLAKPSAVTLPAQPEVRRAFGSQFGVPNMWGNISGLYDRGLGWQQVGVIPFGNERLRLAAGTERLAMVTGAPAMAGWVSESSCVHLEAHTPSGLALGLHLPNRDVDCGYQHLDGRPARVEPGSAVAALSQWADEAALTPSIKTITALVAGRWKGSPCKEDAVLALFDALGLPTSIEILPVIDPEDPVFGHFDRDISRIDMKAAARKHILEKGHPLDPADDLTPQDLDYLRFRDILWASIYPGGEARNAVAAQFTALMKRWPKQ